MGGNDRRIGGRLRDLAGESRAHTKSPAVLAFRDTTSLSLRPDGKMETMRQDNVPNVVLIPQFFNLPIDGRSRDAGKVFLAFGPELNRGERAIEIVDGLAHGPLPGTIAFEDRQISSHEPRNDIAGAPGRPVSPR